MNVSYFVVFFSRLIFFPVSKKFGTHTAMTELHYSIDLDSIVAFIQRHIIQGYKFMTVVDIKLGDQVHESNVRNSFKIPFNKFLCHIIG